VEAEAGDRVAYAGRRAARRREREQQREAQVAARRRLEQQAQRRRVFFWAAGIGAGVVALGLLVWWLAAPPSRGGGIQTFPIQGQIHVPRGQSHPPYNSMPPTSGWHWADAVAPPGVHTEPIPNEEQVHNLEHGEIMIQYDCPSGCQPMVDALAAIVRTYPKKVVLAPYPGIGRPIALTAWGKLAYLDQVDEGFIRRFIADRKDKGPEVFPD
jgi:hypothetical protein